MQGKFKVNSPSLHICYIDENYRDKLEYIKNRTGLTVYKILCMSIGTELDTKEKVIKLRKRLKEYKFKNIGNFYEKLIDYLYNYAQKKDYNEIIQKLKDIRINDLCD